MDAMAYDVELDVGFDEAITWVTEELNVEQFGIIIEAGGPSFSRPLNWD